MTRSSSQTAPDEKPRLIVMIPVIMICLGSILLLFLSNRPERRQFAGPQTHDVAGTATPDTTSTSSDAARAPTSKASPRSAASVPLQPRPLLPFKPAPVPPSAAAPWTGADAGPPAAGIPAGGVLSFGQGAEIRGRVTLAGTPPNEIRIDMTGDPRCGVLHAAPVSTRHYVVDAEGGLANVLVYVKSGVTQKNFPAPATAPLLDQVGCLYEPYVMGVMVNQKFKIKNSDPTLHNVHSTPKVNKEFNFAQPPTQPPPITEKSFSSPEVMVRLKCDVHPWMFAYLGVVAHPFYAVTGTDGTFLLPPDLPPGTYTLEAVHPKAGSATQEITVTTGDRKTVDFTLRVPGT